MQRLSFSCALLWRSTVKYWWLCPPILVSVTHLNTSIDPGLWPLACMQWCSPPSPPSPQKERGSITPPSPSCPSSQQWALVWWSFLKSLQATCHPKLSPCTVLRGSSMAQAACKTCITQTPDGRKVNIYISFTSVIVKLLTLHSALECYCDGHWR